MRTSMHMHACAYDLRERARVARAHARGFSPTDHVHPAHTWSYSHCNCCRSAHSVRPVLECERGHRLALETPVARGAHKAQPDDARGLGGLCVCVLPAAGAVQCAREVRDDPLGAQLVVGAHARPLHAQPPIGLLVGHVDVSRAVRGYVTFEQHSRLWRATS